MADPAQTVSIRSRISNRGAAEGHRCTGEGRPPRRHRTRGVRGVADAVIDHFGKVNQIYNNAGIAYTGDVEVTPVQGHRTGDGRRLLGCRQRHQSFLPHLIASGDGHVVNVSSIFGLFSVAGQAAYNAAKFAVRGFTEALRQEMIWPAIL